MDLFKIHRRTPVDSDIKIINLKQISERNWTFDIYATDRFSANQFLRIVSTQIPSFALGDVYIYTNTSYLAEEIISSRIGQIPIVSNKSIVDSLRGLDFNTLYNTNNFGFFNINITGNPNSKDRPIIVTSSDLVFETYPPEFSILNDDIVIGRLTAGQEIVISASVQIGAQTFPVKKYSHPKWNPVVNSRFLYDEDTPVSSSSSLNMRSSTGVTNTPRQLYKAELELLGNVSIDDILQLGMKIHKDNFDL